MIVVLLVALIGLIAGSFMILNLSPFEFAQNLMMPFQRKHKSMKQMILETTKKKKVKGIKLLIKETKEVLEATGKSSRFGALCVVSSFLFILGVLIATYMNNYFMLPVAAIGFSFMPFWYVIFTASFYQKQLNGELETALSIITTSYLRNESIITAVEENLNYLNPTVSDVFRAFLTQSKLINSNLKLALERLKEGIKSDVFSEWVDAVIACQEDKTLKSILTPIISKLSDMRVVSAELDYLLYEPMKEFITMAILLIGNIPLIWFLNKDWYHTLMFTAVGKLVLAVCLFVIFISMAAVIRLSKPIEYKR